MRRHAEGGAVGWSASGPADVGSSSDDPAKTSAGTFKRSVAGYGKGIVVAYSAEEVVVLVERVQEA